MNSIKEANLTKIIVVGLFGAIIAAILFYISPPADANQSVLIRWYLTTSATTSIENVIVGTATSTQLIDLRKADQVDLNIQFDASTTASVLHWTYEWSNNNQDWYGEDAGTVTSNILTTHGSTTVDHSWTPEKAGITRKSINIDSIASQYLRIVYSVTGANGQIWTEAVAKRQLR